MDGSLAVLQQTPTPTPTPAPEPTPTPVTEIEVENGEPLEPPSFVPEFVPPELYRLAAAVAIVVVAYYVAKITRQMLGRRVARRFKRPSVSRTVLRTIQVLIFLAGIVVALGVFGLGFGNVALSVGVFSAVVGIILAPIIGNFLSGVFVLSEQPYEIGDMIEIRDINTQGFVEDITLLYTKIFTLDNTFIVLPNGTIRERDVLNFSAEDTRIRLTLEVGVTYESNIVVARAQLEAAAREVDGVIQGGPDIRIGSARYSASPTCLIREFGDSEVLLQLRFWAKEPYKQGVVRSRVLTNVWRRFDEHDIEIPYPHSHMVFDDTSGELQVAMRDLETPAESRAGGATSRAEAVRDPPSHSPVDGEAIDWPPTPSGDTPDGGGSGAGDQPGSDRAHEASKDERSDEASKDERSDEASKDERSDEASSEKTADGDEDGDESGEDH